MTTDSPAVEGSAAETSATYEAATRLARNPRIEPGHDTAYDREPTPRAPSSPANASALEVAEALLALFPDLQSEGQARVMSRRIRDSWVRAYRARVTELRAAFDARAAGAASTTENAVCGKPVPAALDGAPVGHSQRARHHPDDCDVARAAAATSSPANPWSVSGPRTIVDASGWFVARVGDPETARAVVDAHNATAATPPHRVLVYGEAGTSEWQNCDGEDCTTCTCTPAVPADGSPNVGEAANGNRFRVAEAAEEAMGHMQTEDSDDGGTFVCCDTSAEAEWPCAAAYRLADAALRAATPAAPTANEREFRPGDRATYTPRRGDPEPVTLNSAQSWWVTFADGDCEAVDVSELSR